MQIAILATGDEIITGDTLNTNAAVFAKNLSSEGIVVRTHLSAGDDTSALISSIDYLLNNHDVLISIGGLGPTSDDKTRFAFAKYCGLPLVEAREAINHITARVTGSGRQMNAGQAQQALFPEHAKLFSNPFGTALGCHFLWKGKNIFWLPGPPQECLPMFENYIMPLLRSQAVNNKKLLIWQLFGVSEGEIAIRLDQLLADIECVTGYRADAPYLEFKVSSHPSLEEEIKRLVEPIVNPYIICDPRKKMHNVFRENLIQYKRKISVIDEATGGMLESLIYTPETRRYLDFNGKSDNIFHFNGMENYWKTASGKNTIHLMYQIGQVAGYESQEVPFFGSTWVLPYAAEWCCYRMDCFLNSLLAADLE